MLPPARPQDRARCLALHPLDGFILARQRVALAVLLRWLAGRRHHRQDCRRVAVAFILLPSTGPALHPGALDRECATGSSIPAMFSGMPYPLPAPPAGPCSLVPCSTSLSPSTWDTSACTSASKTRVLHRLPQSLWELDAPPICRAPSQSAGVVDAPCCGPAVAGLAAGAASRPTRWSDQAGCWPLTPWSSCRRWISGFHARHPGGSPNLVDPGLSAAPLV